MAESDALRTYRGNCHCGAFVYEVEIPEIKSGFDCNCSICVKKGYLYNFPGRKNFKVVKGSEEALTPYQFGPKNLTHRFCATCATPLLGTRSDGPVENNLAVNLHAIQGLNTWELVRMPYDGAAIGDPYQAAELASNMPSAVVENGKIYTGGCHCGALTIAVASKPLDETYEGAVVCNCSICERNACIWIYPKRDEVVLNGDEANIGKYTPKDGLPFWAKTFCRTCGVNMTNYITELSPEEVAGLEGKSVTAHKQFEGKHPVNARVLDGVDLSKLKVMQFDGWGMIPGSYVNP